MDKNNFKIDYTKYDTFALAVKFKNITEDLDKAFFTVKENPDDRPILQKSLGAGISKISDKAYKKEKTYKLQLESIDSQNFDIDVQYLYDLQVTIGGVVKTVISGFFVVRKSISDYPNVTSQEYDVEVSDEVEAELETTPATDGLTYESDPIAMKTIGALEDLKTNVKSSVVGAINDVKTEVEKNAKENQEANKTLNESLTKVINGETPVSKSENSEKVNNLEIKLDENGVLKIGDVIIPQRKLVASNIEFNTSEAGGMTTIYENVKAGCNYELEFGHLSNTIMKVNSDTQYSKDYRAYNLLMWTGLESSTGLTEIRVSVTPNKISIGAYCITDVTAPKDSTIAVNGTCKVISLYEIIE